MKRRFMGIAIAAVVGVLVAALAWDTALKIALSPSCESDVLFEQKSPDKAFVFTLYRRDCGATTGFVTLLSIRPADEVFDPEARDDVLLINGDVPATASWIHSGRIEVQIPKHADIFRNDQEWNGIAIHYIER